MFQCSIGSRKLRRTDQRAYESCVAAIGRLSEFGHELRRPLADILRNGIYETDSERPRELQNPLLSWEELGDFGACAHEGRQSAEGGYRTGHPP
jgi:hypothetical protein